LDDQVVALGVGPATVLVTLADTAGIPMAVRVGNDTNVPPPAIALIPPATNAAPPAARKSHGLRLTPQDARPTDASTSSIDATAPT